MERATGFEPATFSLGNDFYQKTKSKGKPWWVFISHNGKRTSRQVSDKGAVENVASQIRN